MKLDNRRALQAMMALAALFTASVSQAALVSVTLPVVEDDKGNDCSGVFGRSPTCNVLGPTGTKFSPQIVKYDVNGVGVITATDINPAFPSFAGVDITWSYTGSSSEPTSKGSWSYTRTGSDPAVRYWVAKAGPEFNLFWEVDAADLASGGACFGGVYTDSCLGKAKNVTSGTFETPELRGLSHLTFYDSTGDEASVVPLPAAAWLLLSGLAGLGALGRRRKVD